ncbi:MAG: VWA domain-containing protein, partial [Deltaproteobacteria bacterium]|nr:VWA domain-containing protein [Deltaproteobacteria bacterium]
MDSSALQQHLDFYLSPCGVCSTENLRFTPEMLKIFYIARVIFSETSSHRIKSQSAPLFNRENIFTTRTVETDFDSVRKKKTLMDNRIALERIRSISDIAHLLPREYVIYQDNIFYKKLANRELIRIDYEGDTGGTMKADNFLREEESQLNKSQKVYLLFDNSTSMNGERFKKFFVAKAMVCEYLRRVSHEKPQLYFRSFHSEISDLVKAGTPSEIRTLLSHITHLRTGGGRVTVIGDAIVQAIEDIKADPDLKEAEIMVLTDGFGPVPKDLREQLGPIKLHLILIPDLDIEKILTLYPDRTAWEAGGPDGTRPMPPFWKYYTSSPPPMYINEDDLYQDEQRSYRTASKSVKELKMLEVLQGLNQIYALQEICENYIFIVITSILGETFSITLEELKLMEVSINEMADQDISGLTNDQKMQFLQTVLFLKEYLNVAKNNSKEKPV